MANLDELDGGQGPLPEALVREVDSAWLDWCAGGPERQPHSIGHMEVAKL